MKILCQMIFFSSLVYFCPWLMVLDTKELSGCVQHLFQKCSRIDYLNTKRSSTTVYSNKTQNPKMAQEENKNMLLHITHQSTSNLVL